MVFGEQKATSYQIFKSGSSIFFLMSAIYKGVLVISFFSFTILFGQYCIKVDYILVDIFTAAFTI